LLSLERSGRWVHGSNEAQRHVFGLDVGTQAATSSIARQDARHQATHLTGSLQLRLQAIEIILKISGQFLFAARIPPFM
jgi:hypothetical protein